MTASSPHAASRHTLQRPAAVLLSSLVLLGSGCSVLQDDKIDYKSARQVSGLEVPPDLTQLSRDNRYAVPGSVVSARELSAQQGGATSRATAAVSLGDVRIERAGTQRWLVVNRSPDELWMPIRDFWQENGFVLQRDQQAQGVLETDWAENRAKIPQDFLRESLGKLFDSLYSTGERDKFRTRLERNPNGGTDIFISHRGMIEVYADADTKRTVWQPRPTDTELEAEFLRRLMVKLGVSQEQSQSLMAATPAAPAARLLTDKGQAVLVLDDSLERGWRRVGLALDRASFTVEDRNRSQWVYFVRYQPSQADEAKAAEDKGFFARMRDRFRSTPAAEPQRYQVQIQAQGSQVQVRILRADGQAVPAAEAQGILQLLADDLK